MLKKTIKYTDYNGVEREEDFYFNLNRAEVAKMELGAEGGGGIEKYIEKIVNEHDNKRLVELFDELIRCSYGVKSPDGRQFEKRPELTEAFVQTEAYSNLFIELLQADNMAAFFNAVLPQTDVAVATALAATT